MLQTSLIGVLTGGLVLGTQAIEFPSFTVHLPLGTQGEPKGHTGTVVFLMLPSSRAEKYPDGRSRTGTGACLPTRLAAARAGDSIRRFSKRFTASRGLARRHMVSKDVMLLE